MYALKPAKMFFNNRLRGNADAMQRVERILCALGKSMADVVPFDEDDAVSVVRELQDWPPKDEMPGVPMQHRRSMVFTHLKLEGGADDDPRVAACPEGVSRGYLLQVLGYIDPVRDFHAYDSDERRNMVCWPTRDFGIMNGCSHGCYYCGDGMHGKFLALGMNIQEHMEKVVGPTIEATPQQRCFRLIGWQADIISLEPEYGAFADFLAKIAEYEGRYGYFHSNSNNVDWVETVPHRDRLIGVWSLAAEEVARRVEPASPSAAERIEAMHKLNQWGVPLRVKFKPVVPLKGWHEDYAQLIEKVLTLAKPETIGFCCMIWMALETLKARFDGLIDPEYLKAAEDAEEEMKGQTHAPFPHAARADMYRHLIAEVRKHDARIPIFLSTETREMWAELEDEVGQRATSFMCGCNPIQIPCPRMHLTEGIHQSTFFTPGTTPTFK
jgi:DNA repair photolyase